MPPGRGRGTLPAVALALLPWCASALAASGVHNASVRPQQRRPAPAAEEDAEGGGGLALCERDEIAMAQLVDHVCEPPLRSGEEDDLEVGCWRLLKYNTNFKFTSAVFRREGADGGPPECALVFSGIHATGKDTKWLSSQLAVPMHHTRACGYEVYRPIFNYIWTHVHLPGWEALQQELASPGCSGGVTVAGQSLGGAVAEVVAGCANNGRMSDLTKEKTEYRQFWQDPEQYPDLLEPKDPNKRDLAKRWRQSTENFKRQLLTPKQRRLMAPGKKAARKPLEQQPNDAAEPPARRWLPEFRVKQVFTYGAPGATQEPIEDPLRPGGCFEGRRFYVSEDPVAMLGSRVGNVHAKIAADEIVLPPSKYDKWLDSVVVDWDQADRLGLNRYNCTSARAIRDRKFVKMASGEHHDPIQELSNRLSVKKHGPHVQAEALERLTDASVSLQRRLPSRPGPGPQPQPEGAVEVAPARPPPLRDGRLGRSGAAAAGQGAAEAFVGRGGYAELLRAATAAARSG